MEAPAAPPATMAEKPAEVSAVTEGPTVVDPNAEPGVTGLSDCLEANLFGTLGTSGRAAWADMSDDSESQPDGGSDAETSGGTDLLPAIGTITPERLPQQRFATDTEVEPVLCPSRWRGATRASSGSATC